MKIEKISDTQIRCTLTPTDLADRHLKLSELAYGTEKARSLFQDMVKQAFSEFGFEIDNTPLMIEAIPTADSIVLIITKVEDPEELDTRFSKFAPSPSSYSDGFDNFSKAPFVDKLEGSERLQNLQNQDLAFTDSIQHNNATEKADSNIRLFSFPSFDITIKAARLLSGIYDGSNTLFKDPSDGFYVLAISQSEHSEQDFNRICNMLSEYASLEKVTGATLAYLQEHCDTIFSLSAVQALSK